MNRNNSVHILSTVENTQQRIRCEWVGNKPDIDRERDGMHTGKFKVLTTLPPAIFLRLQVQIYRRAFVALIRTPKIPYTHSNRDRDSHKSRMPGLVFVRMDS